MKDNEIRTAVRESYGKIAQQTGEAASCCGPSACGTGSESNEISKAIGYSDKEMEAVPEGATGAGLR